MSKEQQDYKNTLHLPQTSFDMRANLAAKEPKIIEVWHKQNLYEEIATARANRPLFLLHDGPPYANGQLHQGHLLNKILKDIVVKDRTMANFRAPYIPGWDCHGLPIEVQVDKELGATKASMSSGAILQAYRRHAQLFVETQRQGFIRLGVLGRWQQPYLTMDKSYEAVTIRELSRLMQTGLVYKGLRPVHWCTVHQTALAEAEVEYENYRSPSAYVAFALAENSALNKAASADLLIWTTTPWTLPANVAVAVHPEFVYVAYPILGRLRWVAKERLPAVLAALGEDPQVVTDRIALELTGRELVGWHYRHPFLPRDGQVVLGEHVTLDVGTGCVHTAPGHGADDFHMARLFHLPVLSPVDARGYLTAEAGPFAGLSILEANTAILTALKTQGSLLNDPHEMLEHRYAHCWRCHKPLITRATEQWFLALDKPNEQGNTLRQQALAALQEVKFIPTWGKTRISSMIQARPDWCLSRQRRWGVPIAVLYCTGCDHVINDAVHMERVAELVAQHGIEIWFEKTVEELFGPLVCPKCASTSFRKEQDILDVWFDSGVSYAAVMEQEGLVHAHGAPIDLYLEGSDQHRGWFHSALLCAIATRQQAPYRALLTHGFVVDGQGKKISKSKGNFIDPFKTIERDGADMLRLWVAYEDYREDIRLSQEILTRLADSYRKIRNTLRFMLGNLFDFVPTQQMLAKADLLDVDQYMLLRLLDLNQQVQEHYKAYNFHLAIQQIHEMCTVDLSSFYLDILKDRLYASGKNSQARRSAQTVLYLILRDMLRLLAPILSFTAEEAWWQLPRLPTEPHSVHLTLYPGLEESPLLAAYYQIDEIEQQARQLRYTAVLRLRGEVNVALEQARRQKKIGSSVQAKVILQTSQVMYQELAGLHTADLADLLIVSQVVYQTATFLPETTPVSIHIEQAEGSKCARCWLYRQEVGEHALHPLLCKRCIGALEI